MSYLTEETKFSAQTPYSAQPGFYNAMLDPMAGLKQQGPKSSSESSENLHALQATLQAIGSLGKLASQDDKKRVIESILTTIKTTFGWSYSSYWELNPEGNALVFYAQSGSVNAEFEQITQQASFPHGVGLSGRTWKEGRLVFVEDLGTVTDCCRRESAVRAGVKSGVCFPILTHGEFRGTMDFFMTQRISLSEERKRTLEAVARLVSLIFAQLDTSLSELESQQINRALTEVLHSVQTARTEAQVLANSLESIKSAFGWEYGSFWRFDPQQRLLRFEQESGQVNTEFAELTRSGSFQKGVGLSGKTWETNDVVFVQDLGKVADCFRAPVATKAGVKSGICFPVWKDQQFLGTMDFFTTTVLRPSARRDEALRNVAETLSDALQQVEKKNLQQEAALASSEIAGSMAKAADLATIAKEKGATSLHTISDLTQTASEINSIVELIQEIANQTNLLALNATIEAARAGDSGKGFAVVANEVKNLAQKSNEATASIQTQIQEIQKRTKQASDSIGQIVESINDINTANQSVASAIEEQSVVINSLAN